MASYVKEWHQKDLLGTHVVDFEERIDIERLRSERLQRLQAEMAKLQLGAVLLFDPTNARYATGTRLTENFCLRFKARHALVPVEGKPIMFNANELEEPVLGDNIIRREVVPIEFWTTGSYTRDNIKEWAGVINDSLKEMGVAGEKMGVDRLDALTMHALENNGIQLDDALEPLSMARAIKTEDEIALIKQACAIGDVALWEVQQAIEPGVTEDDMFAVMLYTNLRYGGERIDDKQMTAGGNTNPWLKRNSTDRIIRHGDLVGMDTDMVGPMGYFADISRTYLCGDGKPNEEQLDAYHRAYDFIQQCLPLFKPGISFQELAEKVPDVPEEYRTNRYPLIAHGDGMSDEWPGIYFRYDASARGGINYEGVLQENMVMSMEASFGREDGREQVKLEEQLIVTSDGPLLISQAPYDERLVPY